MQRPEQKLQIPMVEAIRWQYPRALVFHIPNGGKRTKFEAVILKKMGVVAGIADLCIMWLGGIGFMEVKADEKGKLTLEQGQFGATCEGFGFPWACVCSIDQALNTLKSWGCK